MTQEELNQKLAQLREDWKLAGIGMKRLIKVRADLLKKQFAEQDKPQEELATPEQAEDLFKMTNVEEIKV